jgi:hypothetical protein
MARRRMMLALFALGILCVASLTILWFLPPVFQDPNYHNFADQRTVFGIPNFWNVVSNAAFLVAAAFGFRTLWAKPAFTQTWEVVAFGILLAGTVMVAFGSAYYHLLLILLPPLYSGSEGLFATIALYGMAKLFEVFDSQLTSIVSTGGHPWKHLAAAAAMMCYVMTVARRRACALK